MVQQSVPFFPPELVELFLTTLVDGRGIATRDLRSCSLVSRSWAGAAQRYLFERVSVHAAARVDNTARLLETLKGNPRFVRYIRRLRIWVGKDADVQGLASVCAFQFTHVETVSFVGAGFFNSATAVRAMAPLLGLSTIRTVHVNHDAGYPALQSNPSYFGQFWEQCSPSVKRLVLDIGGHAGTLEPTAVQERTVKLQSLVVDLQSYLPMLHATLFDLSRLKHLSLLGIAYINPSLHFLPAWKSLTSLHILFTFHAVFARDNLYFDLSLLPNLAHIHFVPTLDTQDGALDVPLDMLSTLGTQGTSSKLRTIVVEFMFFQDLVTEKLDKGLARLVHRLREVQGETARPLEISLLAVPEVFVQYEERLMETKQTEFVTLRRMDRNDECTCTTASTIYA
ncbi:hypothetical protein MKEN_01001400 [Mycena kentingensis (nom. inval.)]|nr:hypothetical protein MKEN_01001400 [Mycena kentingensis (nom. inval.)]